MGDLRDLPGELNVTLYVGRPTTLTLTWPATLAGKTFSCLVSYGGAAPTTYSVSVSTVTMTIAFPATDYPGESGPGTLTILETTGGLTTPIIVGKVNVVRTPGTGFTAANVTVLTQTVAVTINTLPALFPTFATVAARTSGIAVPVAGNGAYLTTPKIMTWYNGASWDGQVPTFATTTARDTAIPTPDNGMLVRISATNTLSLYAAGWLDGFGGTTFNDARYAPVAKLTKRFTQIGVAGTFTADSALAAIVVPAQSVPGWLLCWGQVLVDKTVAGDDADVRLKDGGTGGTVFAHDSLIGTSRMMAHPMGQVQLPVSTSKTINLNAVRNAGSGNLTTYADMTINALHVLFIPD